MDTFSNHSDDPTDRPTRSPRRDAEADAPPLAREANPPRRDGWLLPVIAGGCALAGVALGFGLGRASVAPTTAAPAVVAGERGDRFDRFDRFDVHPRMFAFNMDVPVPPMPPVPPVSPMGPGVRTFGDCDGDDCTTIIKQKPDGSMIIVKQPRRAQ